MAYLQCRICSVVYLCSGIPWMVFFGTGISLDQQGQNVEFTAVLHQIDLPPSTTSDAFTGKNVCVQQIEVSSTQLSQMSFAHPLDLSVCLVNRRSLFRASTSMPREAVEIVGNAKSFPTSYSVVHKRSFSSKDHKRKREIEGPTFKPPVYKTIHVLEIN